MREHAPLALAMSFFAGMSTFLGSLPVLLCKKASQNFLSFSIGFSAGIMSMLSAADLFPESVRLCVTYIGKTKGAALSILFLFSGVFAFSLMEKYIPNPDDLFKKEKSLWRAGILSAIGIMLHNFPEGMATFIAGTGDLGRGLSLAIAIALHNIPEGITVSVPIYYSTGSRLKAAAFAALTGLSEPLGAALTFLLLSPYLSLPMLGFAFAFAAGMMLCICFFELIPAASRYGKTTHVLSGALFGLIVMSIIMKLL